MIYPADKYDRVITISTNGKSGTRFPRGTKEMPCNNLKDAQYLIEQYGMAILNLQSHFTINEGDDLSGYTIVGNGFDLILKPGCITNDTTFDDLVLIGELNGRVFINNCVIGTIGISNFHGEMQRVLINGDISVCSDNTKEVLLIDCHAGTPKQRKFNCGGDGPKIFIRGLRGEYLFTNRVISNHKLDVFLEAGNVEFDSFFNVSNSNVINLN